MIPSLRRRLPLLISGLIAVVLATFLWAAYQVVQRTLVETAAVRAREIANQIGSLLMQSGQQRRAEMLRVASDPAVREYLRHRGEPAAARARLAALAAPNVAQSIELWTGSGERVLTVVMPPEAAATVPAGLPPSPSDRKPLRVYGKQIFSETFVSIEGDGVTPGTPNGAPLGFLLIRRPLAAGNSDGLNRLIGSGAAFAVGNKADAVWTDLAKQIPPPAVDFTRPGVAQYRVWNGVRRIGVLADVADTAWSVWLDFPESTVLAPARRFLQRMGLVALVFIGFAAAATSLLSARITRPLHELTEASEAIAAGQYSRRVVSERRDEIGRLGAAFNAMATQVHGVQRQLEEQVQRRTARLEETSAALAQRVSDLDALTGELEAFSYSVSHDLRAPLRHVTGFASLLERSAGSRLTEKDARYLRTIVEAAERMGRLIDDLLAFSRMGRAPLARQRVSLDALVQEARAELHVTPGHTIDWTIRPLPSVEADPAMLRLVLVNLLSNAVKYTSGRDRPAIEVGEDGSTPRETVLYVRDNGVGFDMQYVHKLFGVFQRLHSSDEFEGTGIGLANVRRIVHRHGGRVWAEGVVDTGATFFIALPKGGEAHS